MRVIFASAEVFPFSKTGGLGDVVGSLSAALVQRGHEVLVVSPWYRKLRSGVPLWVGDVDVPFDGGFEKAGVGTLERGGVRFAFVGHSLFDRDRLYGYPDDVRRFCLFSRSVPQLAARLGFAPDLVHLHDWHCSYLPLLLRRGWHLPPGFPGLPTVLTVHNAQYQGTSGVEETLRWLRLAGDLPLSAAGGTTANALRAGVESADAVTTVSPSYASELVEPEFAYGLEATFKGAAHKLSGILNGIDGEVWNPQRDPHLPQPYGASDLSGKREAKRLLCERAGLDEERPLLGVVSRLAEQKGIDLLLGAARDLERQGWSLFVLGTGEPELEQGLLEASRKSPAIAVDLEYDEPLAHLVYAGADALAVPSRFEPCGLSQLIAMRYGTLPIARATGGLRDTIRHGQTGFLFSELSPRALARSAEAAVACYGTGSWHDMVQAAMGQDFSWERSANRYAGLYRSLVEAR